MARCGCASTGCSCRIVEGDGIFITGSGLPNDPFIINSQVASFTGSFVTQDSTSVDLLLVGKGIPSDPFILSAQATLAMTELGDWDDVAGPSDGEVPVWVVDHWEAQTPPTVPPGAVNTGSGVTGDGTVGDPIQAALSELVEDSTDGLGIYVDTDGLLRAVPPAGAGSVAWGDLTGVPVTFPPTIGLTGTTAAAGNHKTNAADITTGILVGARGGTGLGSVYSGRVFGSAGTVTPRLVAVDSSGNMGSVSGALHPTYIPSLNASQIVAGEFLPGLIPNYLYAENVTTNAYGRQVSGSGFFAMWMDSGLRMARNTSSRRFKEDIAPYEITDEQIKALGDLVVSYHRKGSDEMYEVGAIAEDVHDAGLTWAVTWFAEPDVDSDGVPTGMPSPEEPVIDGLRYDLLSLVPAVGVSRLYARVEDLETRLAALEG
jgi:hypothetical protein